MASPPPMPGRNLTWWDRNWKWCVVLIVAGSLAAMAAFFVGVTGLLKKAEPYQIALARAREHPEVIAALGTPIEEGFFVTGTRQANAYGGQVRGTAVLSTTLTGPKAKATLWINGSQSNGVWRLERAIIKIEGRNETIDLSDPPARKKGEACAERAPLRC